MNDTPRAQLHVDQVNAGADAIVKVFRAITPEQARQIAELAIDAADTVPDERKAFAVNVVSAAFRAYREWSTDPDSPTASIAQRQLFEIFATEDEREVKDWDLKIAGRKVGEFRGTRAQYSKVQGALTEGSREPSVA